MSKQNRIRTAIAAALTIGALAASAPSMPYAHAVHGGALFVMVEPGGGGH